MSLSFCLIAKNEATVITKCLQSIQYAADEIVIGIDDRTTDGTDDLVKKFGVKPFYFHWINNFAFARNLTMDKATGSHIFIIDADERLTMQGWQLINILLRQSEISNEAFAFNIRNTRLTGELIQVTPGPVRLIPNRPNIRYKYVMHETLSNIEKYHYMTFDVLEHVGFDPALIGKPEERFIRNEQLLIERILQDFNDATAWRYLAYFYRYSNMNEQASICAQEALRLPSKFDPEDYIKLKTIGERK